MNYIYNYQKQLIDNLIKKNKDIVKLNEKILDDYNDCREKYHSAMKIFHSNQHGEPLQYPHHYDLYIYYYESKINYSNEDNIFTLRNKIKNLETELNFNKNKTKEILENRNRCEDMYFYDAGGHFVIKTINDYINQNNYKEFQYVTCKRMKVLWRIADYYTARKYAPENILKYISLDEQLTYLDKYIVKTRVSLAVAAQSLTDLKHHTIFLWTKKIDY